MNRQVARPLRKALGPASPVLFNPQVVDASSLFPSTTSWIPSPWSYGLASGSEEGPAIDHGKETNAVVTRPKVDRAARTRPKVDLGLASKETYCPWLWPQA